jgi:hypothetical protein
MAGSYKFKSNKSDLNKYFKNSHKIMLLKEIIVLITIAVLIVLFILFFSSFLSKNIFLVKFPAGSGINNNGASFFNYENLNGEKKSAINFGDKSALEFAGSFNQNIANKSKTDSVGRIVKDKNFIEIFLKPSNSFNICSIGNYLKFNLKAKNENSADFPAGSINIKWKYENEQSYNPLNQESMQIYIDGFYHNYYDAIGENKNWQ